MHQNLHAISEDLFKLYSDGLIRYEFTVTFNPRYIPTIEYAESLCTYVIEDIFKLGLSVSTRKERGKKTKTIDEFFFNIVVEQQKNGYPHLHGTLIIQDFISPSTCKNWENKFYRKYGKTDVYATGKIDKIHNNDHFNGPWSEYIKKENTPWYYHFNPNYTDATKQHTEEQL